MKLLILTQKVDINDDLLGFFHTWIREFARHCEQVTVIALGAGEYDLPENVKVLSLGKEKYSRNSQNSQYSPFIRRFALALNFYKLIYQERHNYDTVFVHMNKEYALLGGPPWRLWGKRVLLWYTHKQTGPGLWLAEKLVHDIYTASPESFGLKSKKTKVVGHGIDTEYFRPPLKKARNEKKEIIYVGRISPIKNQMLAVEAIKDLKDQEVTEIHLSLIGGTTRAEEDEYKNKIEKFIQANDLQEQITLTGPIPNRKLLPFYHHADLALNLCPTGGMDKAVLEALACGVPVVIINTAFESVTDKYFIKNKNELIGAIKQRELINPDRNNIERMSITSLINTIIK